MQMKRISGLIILIVMICLISIFAAMPVMAEDGLNGPNVKSTYPANGVTLKMIQKAVTVAYTENVNLVSDIWRQEVSIKNEKTGNYETFECITKGYYLIIIPTNELNDNTRYTISVGGNVVQDENLIHAPAYSFGFTTAAEDGPKVISTNPANGATGISLDSEIYVDYSEKIFSTNSYSDINIAAPGELGIGFGVTYPEKSTSGKRITITLGQGAKLDTKYVVTIGKVYKDAAGNLSEPYTFSFTTKAADTTAPKVVSTSPADGDTIKALSKYYNSSQILVAFSETIKNVGNNTTGAISVTNEDGNDAGFYAEYGTYPNEKTLQILSRKVNQTIEPGKYTVKINRGYFMDATGNRNNAYSFSFTIAGADTTAPKVVSTSPSNGATGVASDLRDIHIIFSEGIARLSDSVASLITIKDAQGNSISNKISHQNDDDIVPLVFLDKLKPNTQYNVTIPQGVLKDLAGNGNVSYSFSFTTANEAKVVIPVKQFSDVPTNHWAYQAVMEMAKLGILNGYSDGTFRPEDNVTREEFAKMMVLALNLPINEPVSPYFKDVKNSYWAYKFVESAKSYLTGYQKADGMYFKGTNNAVREDMAYALVKAKGLNNQSVDMSKLNTLFKDVNKITADLKKYVLIAYENGIIKGNADGTFNPKGTLTRAEASKLLYNVISQDNDDSGKVIVR